MSKVLLSPPSLILPHPLKPILCEATYWRPLPSLPSKVSALCTQNWLLASLLCFFWLVGVKTMTPTQTSGQPAYGQAQ